MITVFKRFVLAFLCVCGVSLCGAASATVCTFPVAAILVDSGVPDYSVHVLPSSTGGQFVIGVSDSRAKRFYAMAAMAMVTGRQFQVNVSSGSASCNDNYFGTDIAGFLIQ